MFLTWMIRQRWTKTSMIDLRLLWANESNNVHHVYLLSPVSVLFFKLIHPSLFRVFSSLPCGTKLMTLK